jgi:PAS domain S-box-containing protein
MTVEEFDFWAKLLGFIGAVSASTIGFYKFLIKPIYNHFKSIKDLSEKTKIIYQEITPNGGSSIKDAVKRLEQRSIRIENSLIILQNIQDAIHEDGNIAIFECDINGSNIHVNRTYCKWIGVSKHELLKFGWKNFLSDSELNKKYDKLWKEAFKEGREIEYSLLLRDDDDGKDFSCSVHAYPIKNEEGIIDRYLGLMSRDE